MDKIIDNQVFSEFIQLRKTNASQKKDMERQEKTIEKLLALEKDDSRIGIIEFSRNFGKENAMTAGLDYISGDAVVIIMAPICYILFYLNYRSNHILLSYVVVAFLFLGIIISPLAMSSPIGLMF